MVVCIGLVTVPVLALGFISILTSMNVMDKFVGAHLQEQSLMITNDIKTAIELNQRKVSSNLKVAHEIFYEQGNPVVSPDEMLEMDAVLGGEDSGHMIFRDVHTTGDGILAALRLLGALQRAGKPLSELAKVMTLFPQKLINVDVKAKPDFMRIPEISHAIARAEGLLGEKGRVLVRYSGTQNKCRVMVEGPTEEQTDALCRQIAATIQRMIG